MDAIQLWSHLRQYLGQGAAHQGEGGTQLMRYIGKKARFGFVEGCELLGLLGEQLIGSLVGPVKKENRQQQNRQQRDGDEGRALDGSGLRNVILQGQALGLIGELKGVSFLLECVFGFQPGSGSGLGFTAQAIGHLVTLKK